MRKEVRGALVGMAFGDGYVNTSPKFKNGLPVNRSELRVLHSVAQKDYCEHKCGVVNKLLNRHCSVTEVKNGPGGKYKAAQFSVSHPYFKQIKKWLYPNGVKTYTEQNLSMLTPEGIAYWYMDDGSARRNISVKGIISSVSTNISTMCSKDEVNRIIDYFSSEHGIAFKRRYDKRKRDDIAWYIECNTTESRKFGRLIEPYVIPSMLYKLSHLADLDSQECQAPVSNCVTCGRNMYENRRAGLCSGCYSKRYYHQVRKYR